MRSKKHVSLKPYGHGSSQSLCLSPILSSTCIVEGVWQMGKNTPTHRKWKEEVSAKSECHRNTFHLQCLVQDRQGIFKVGEAYLYAEKSTNGTMGTSPPPIGHFRTC